MVNEKIEQLIKEEKENQEKIITQNQEIDDLLQRERESSIEEEQIKEEQGKVESEEIDKLLNEENKHIKRLHQIVKDTIKKEKLLISGLLNPAEETLTFGQKLSDKVASFGGSWKFIISFGIFLTIWMTINSILPLITRFDPYPFILLNLLLSTIAALQAPIIMMSQNRKEAKERIRSENDYMIDLKSEMQIRSLHKKMNLLLEKQIKTLYESQTRQFMILKEINHKLDVVNNDIIKIKNPQ
jgi:uncharacterized membrane protein